LNLIVTLCLSILFNKTDEILPSVLTRKTKLADSNQRAMGKTFSSEINFGGVCPLRVKAKQGVV
jgi:hypothetical protein